MNPHDPSYLRKRRLQAVYGHSTNTLVLTLLIAPYIAWRLGKAAPGGAAWEWWAIISALATARLALAIAYHRATGALADDTLLWRNAYVFAAAVMGVAWGWLAWGIPELPMNLRLMLLVVLSSINAASLMSHSQHLPSYIAFCTPVFASMAYGATRLPSEHHLNLYSIAVLSWVVLLVVAYRLSRSFTELVIAQREAENARLHAQEAGSARSRFLAQMSHEIRTPINGMMGMAQLLRNLELAPPAPAYVRAILDSGRRLLGVVNDVLDYSKAESGQMKLITQPVELRSLLEELCLTYRSASERKGISFALEVDAAVPETLSLDPQRIGQILSNLLDNAIKYTDSGRIDLSVGYKPDSAKLRFIVSDTGVGMSESACQEVFQPFVQADSAGDRLRSGTGLGLSIVAELVELHDGEMRLHSRLGVGSRFEITLPAKIVRGTDPQIRVTTADLKGLRILVVDDVPLNLELVKTMVEHLGASTLSATNGEEAIAVYREDHPNLILMDCQMPVLDGLEASRRIRALESGAQHCPIIALSAFTEQQHREECLRAGMDECLAKPVDYYQLKETMERLISEHRARPQTAS